MIPAIILTIENDHDRDLMISVYLELYPSMKEAACKIVKNNTTAEDVVHDTITSLIRNLGTIRNIEKKQLASYVLKAVKNRSIDYCKRHKKIEKTRLYDLNDDFWGSTPEDSNPVELRIEQMEEYEELGQIIARLPEKQQEILFLKYNMQLSDEEIGELMGIQKDSVRQYLTRARRNAKNHMIKEGAANVR